MKKQKSLIILIFFIFSIIIGNQIKVLAEVNENIWTDFSKATPKVEMKKEAIIDGSLAGSDAYYLSFENVEYNNNILHEYYIFMANTNLKPVFGNSRDDLRQNADAVWESGSDRKVSLNDYIEKGKDIYVWIVEIITNDEAEIREAREVLTAQKISIELEEEVEKKLGDRIITKFYDASVFVYVSSVCKEDTNVQIEIGEVESKKVLKAIKNEEDEALEGLMEYAKNTTPIYSNEITIGTNQNLLDEVELKEETYYYAYAKVKNNDNAEIEDISLYQTPSEIGTVYGNDKKYSKAMQNYRDSNFVWFGNLDSEEIEDEDSSNGEDLPDDEDKKDDELENKKPNSNPKTDKDFNLVDNTIAKGPIPQTGEIAKVIVLIILSFGIGVIFLLQYIIYKYVIK